MRINNESNKRPMAFEQIREGTVFGIKQDEDKFIKGSGGAAVNLKTGKLSYPANDAGGGWEKCVIYPGASLSLGE